MRTRAAAPVACMCEGATVAGLVWESKGLRLASPLRYRAIRVWCVITLPTLTSSACPPAGLGEEEGVEEKRLLCYTSKGQLEPDVGPLGPTYCSRSTGLRWQLADCTGLPIRKWQPAGGVRGAARRMCVKPFPPQREGLTLPPLGSPTCCWALRGGRT